MSLLNQFGVFALSAGLLLAGHATRAAAQAKGAGLSITPVSNAALTAPMRIASGTVKSIVGRVLRLDSKGRDIAFTVDENTQVVARAGGRAARNAGSTLQITDLIRSGEVARVEYRELDGAMRVSEIRLSGRKQVASR